MSNFIQNEDLTGAEDRSLTLPHLKASEHFIIFLFGFFEYVGEINK